MDVIHPVVWLLLGACGTVGADAQRFVISQARPQLPVMTAYLDIVDADGQPVADLSSANFAAVLGTTSMRVTDIKPFGDTGEGVAYVFLIDISKSMPRARFGEMRAAITSWIGELKPPDRIAIATFGERYNLRQDFTCDRGKLTATLDSLAPQDEHTRLYFAIDQAVELEQRVDPDLPFRRVIILLSDGKDEGSALTPDDVLLKLRASRLPIYSIGLSHLRRAEKQRYLDVLHRFSNASGGLFQEAGALPVVQLYAAIRQAIRRVFVAHLACPACQADGRSLPLEITLTQGTHGLKAAPLDVVPLPAPAKQIPGRSLSFWSRIPWWAWAAGAAAMVAAVFALLLKRNNDVSSTDLGGLESDANEQSGEQPRSASDDAGLSLRLTVVTGQDAGSSHALRLLNSAVIGRSEECDVVLPDPEVSNRHCELALINGRVVVYDLGSKNKTYVNGVPIRGRHRLEPQDTIQLGDTELRVHFEES